MLRCIQGRHRPLTRTLGAGPKQRLSATLADRLDDGMAPDVRRLLHRAALQAYVGARSRVGGTTKRRTGDQGALDLRKMAAAATKRMCGVLASARARSSAASWAGRSALFRTLSATAPKAARAIEEMGVKVMNGGR